MSTIISEETKSVSITKEARAWRLEIFSEKNTDYTVKVHTEEIEIIDGIEKDAVKKGSFVVPVKDIIASDEILNYTDVDGNEKSIPTKDIPAIITEWTNQRRNNPPVVEEV